MGEERGMLGGDWAEGELSRCKCISLSFPCAHFLPTSIFSTVAAYFNRPPAAHFCRGNPQTSPGDCTRLPQHFDSRLDYFNTRLTEHARCQIGSFVRNTILPCQAQHESPRQMPTPTGDFLPHSNIPHQQQHQGMCYQAVNNPSHQLTVP